MVTKATWAEWVLLDPMVMGAKRVQLATKEILGPMVPLASVDPREMQVFEVHLA
jgi:hypothetical protein